MNKYLKFLKKKRFYLLMISIISFLAIMIFVLKENTLNLDIKGYELISTYIMNDKITPIVKVITHIGSAFAVISLTIIFYFILKDKRMFYGILCNLGLSFSLNTLIKLIISRERPIGNRLIEVNGYSFPSSHAMVSMAYFGFIIYLIYIYSNSKYKKLFIFCLSILILLIGLSRIYLGVHYLSDVLGGFLFSLGYLVIYVYLFNKLMMNKRKE